MAKIQQFVKYEGNNDELFVKVSADALNYDAKLIVPETHNAILLKDGVMMDTLNSGSYDIFDSKHKKKTESITVDVIYMSKTAKLKVNWGTKTQFNFRDTETDVPIKVGAHGEFEVQICNPRKAYLELIGADKTYSVEKLKERLAMRMMSEVEPAIARAMREQRITYDRMGEHKKEISQSVLPVLSKMFEEEYGLKMFSFTIANVMIAEEYVKAIEAARAEVKRKAEEEKARIEREEKEERARREEKEEQERQDEKEWEREKWLRELQSTDYEKYLDVCRERGWEPKAGGAPAAKTQLRCPKCGAPYEEGDMFCDGCGLPLTCKVCPSCHAENKLTAHFCKKCGTKL